MAFAQRQNRCDRMGVVRCKLWEERVARRQHPFGAGKVRDIGGCLAREDRITGKPLNLCALDLRVPIGAFYQSQRNAFPSAAGELREPIDNGQRALLIGLHGEAQAVVIREVGMAIYALENVQRQVQPFALFDVDRQPNVRPLRSAGEIEETGRQFRQHSFLLREFVARVQCRKLD